MPIDTKSLKKSARAAISENALSFAVMTGLVLAVYICVTLCFEAVAMFTNIQPDSLDVYSLMYLDHFNDIDYTLLSLLSLAAHAVITLPMLLGLERELVLAIDGRRAEVAGVFYYMGSFRRLLGAVCYRLTTVVRVVGIYLLCWLPACAVILIGATAHLFMTDSHQAAELQMLTADIATPLELLAVLATVLFAVRYVIADAAYILGNSRRDSLRMAGRLVRGNRIALFATAASFFWWLLLGIFVFPLLYVVPYLLGTLLLHGVCVIGRDRRDQNKKEDEVK